ncbi:MAG: hypothetical protein ACI35R_14300, partial [Bacillus sp. (in: firmicutes)]
MKKKLKFFYDASCPKKTVHFRPNAPSPQKAGTMRIPLNPKQDKGFRNPGKKPYYTGCTKCNTNGAFFATQVARAHQKNDKILALFCTTKIKNIDISTLNTTQVERSILETDPNTTQVARKPAFDTDKYAWKIRLTIQSGQGFGPNSVQP